QAPLTLDHATVTEMLDEAEIGLAGEETAIGDAIGLAVKHLRDRPADERVLILLSDGANNAGVLEPAQAAEIAGAEGIRIYTIGLGTGAQMVRTPFGTRLASGQSQLDEAALRQVAQLTGGTYFRARDTASLLHAHQQIDALERTEGEALTVHPTRALFYWPLAGALLGAASLMALAAAREWPLYHWRSAEVPDDEAIDELRPWRVSA
ncbi:MAG: VWA domain-containing protein, partial [Myxococcota bacterium]